MTVGGPRSWVPGLGGLALCVAIAACGDESRPTAEARAAPSGNAATVELGCAEGGPAPDRARRGDLPYGPFVLIGIDEGALSPRRPQAGIARPPDAFGRHGYKIPVSLPNGTSAVLAIPRFERGRLGLAFTPRAQRRAVRDGVDGTDLAIRFTACPRVRASGRTGWPGGFVVDKPHCATVTVDPDRSPTTNFGLPLGRACS